MKLNENEIVSEIEGEIDTDRLKKPKNKPRGRALRTVVILLTAIALAAAALLGSLIMIYYGPSENAETAFTVYAEKCDIGFVREIPSFFTHSEGDEASSETMAPDDISDEAFTLPETKKAEIFPISEPVHEKIVSESDNSFTDGVRLDNVKKDRFTARVLLVKDPSRVYVAAASDFKSNMPGLFIEDLCKRESLVAAVNGGADKSGGSMPGGLVISGGKLLFSAGVPCENVVGIGNDGVLSVGEMTAKEVEEKGFRDALGVGQILISDGEIVYKPNEEVVTSLDLPNPRTAIGQLADGTVILVCIDGRRATSLGATLAELCELLSEYGAVTAANLSGGASSAMVYDGELVSTPSNLNGTKRLPTFVGVKGVTDIEE